MKYHECGNASEAYRGVYSCVNMKPDSVNNKAYELLRKVEITARVKELQNATAKRSDITKERILGELAKIGFSSIASMHNTWIDRKLFEELTDEQKASIKSISTRVRRAIINDEPIEVEEVKIELYDKLRALESISKMLGYDAPIKTEITGKGGESLRPIVIEVQNNTTKELTKKLLNGEAE